MTDHVPDTHQRVPAKGGPLLEKALVDFGVACRFGDTASRDALIELMRAVQAAERKRCAAVCERLAAEEHAEMMKQPVGSPARDRYFARKEALRSAAVEVRLGPNLEANLAPTASEEP